MRERGTAMLPTSKLEVVGNLWHRYDNSSPRYGVRTTMLSLVPSPKFPTFPTYNINITLLFFPYVLKRVASIRLQKSEIFLIIFYLLMLLFTFGIEFRVHSIFSVLYPV